MKKYHHLAGPLLYLTTEYEFDPSRTFHPSEEEIGIDLGINSFAALSDGTFIENPRIYRNAEEDIQRAVFPASLRARGPWRGRLPRPQRRGAQPGRGRTAILAGPGVRTGVPNVIAVRSEPRNLAARQALELGDQQPVMRRIGSR